MRGRLTDAELAAYLDHARAEHNAPLEALVAEVIAWRAAGAELERFVAAALARVWG